MLELQPKLGRCLQLAAELEQTLIRETDALTHLDTAALTDANQRKSRLFSELMQQLDDKALRRLIAGEPQAATEAQVSELVDCLARCRSINDIAGSSIALLIRNNREALTLLGVASEPPAYGSSGRGTTDSSHRALAVC